MKKKLLINVMVVITLLNSVAGQGMEEKKAKPKRKGRILGLLTNRKELNGVLFSAIEKKDCNLVQKAIETGANVDSGDQNKNTPLHQAVYSENSEIVKMVLEAKPRKIDPKNKTGRTPLFCAVQGPIEIVKLLVNAGASVNAADNNGKTPLCEAVEEEKIDMIKLLLKNKACVNTPLKNGDTPLSIAQAKGKTQITDLLIGHKN